MLEDTIIKLSFMYGYFFAIFVMLIGSLIFFGYRQYRFNKYLENSGKIQDFKDWEKKL